MTTIDPDRTIGCGVCGERSRPTKQPSAPPLGSQDLDFRPPGRISAERCPACGYCAPNGYRFSLPAPSAASVIREPRYRRQLLDTEHPEMVRRLLCCSMLDEALANEHPRATWLLQAAWACDDASLDGLASHFRLLALQQLEAGDGHAGLLKVDLLRRVGRLDDALKAVEAAERDSATNDERAEVLAFQRALVEHGDTRRYTVAKAAEFDRLRRVRDFLRDNGVPASAARQPGMEILCRALGADGAAVRAWATTGFEPVIAEACRSHTVSPEQLRGLVAALDSPDTAWCAATALAGAGLSIDELLRAVEAGAMTRRPLLGPDGMREAPAGMVYEILEQNIAGLASAPDALATARRALQSKHNKVREIARLILEAIPSAIPSSAELDGARVAARPDVDMHLGDTSCFSLVCVEPPLRIELSAGQTLHIGRRPTNDVVVAHPTIGSRQCVVRRSATGVTIEDARSPGGTFVNGASINGPAPINPGDNIRIGGLHFVVEGARPADQLPRSVSPAQLRHEVSTGPPRHDVGHRKDLIDLANLQDLSGVPLQELQAARETLSLMVNYLGAQSQSLPKDMETLAFAIGGEIERRLKEGQS